MRDQHAPRHPLVIVSPNDFRFEKQLASSSFSRTVFFGIRAAEKSFFRSEYTCNGLPGPTDGRRPLSRYAGRPADRQRFMHRLSQSVSPWSNERILPLVRQAKACIQHMSIGLRQSIYIYIYIYIYTYIS